MYVCMYVYVCIYIYRSISLSLYIHIYIYICTYLSLSIYISLGPSSARRPRGEARAIRSSHFAVTQLLCYCLIMMLGVIMLLCILFIVTFCM